MRALIIANGSIPAADLTRRTAARSGLIVCADGGANHARELEIVPHVIIGDFDSVVPSTLQYFSGARQLRIADQDSTDLEKAIKFCIEQKASQIDVIGASGDRVDHVTGALGCFKKFPKAHLELIDSVGTLSRIDGLVTFEAAAGEKISLIPLERCTGITTENLLYPLQDAMLELGVREGISNQAVGRPVTISVVTGTLLLYRFHR